jgi:phosphoribosyl-ATP pyrophosphohydrolase/phosphoribosyl-AMP cyclohydrolase/histidinol dehydrogenase
VNTCTPAETVAEAADLVYFTLVKVAVAGGRWSDVAEELDRRRLRVSRRAGNAKPNRQEPRR